MNFFADVRFAAVLWGDKYPRYYVEKLFRGLRENCSFDIPFLLLTDRNDTFPEFEKELTKIKCRNPWPGWWQKINFFDHDFVKTRYVIYFDLDVVFLKSIDPMLAGFRDYDFVCAEDCLDDLSSSCMIIDTKSDFAREVYRSFEPRFCSLYQDDQDHIKKYLDPTRFSIKRLACSDHYSYKYLIGHEEWATRPVNPVYRRQPIETIRTLNFHGYPKPHHLMESPGKWAFSDEILSRWS